VGAPRINWDDLRFFGAALRKRSLAGAARELGVEHSTVLRRLAALDAPLFVRLAHGLRPTALGEQLAPLVGEIDRSIEAVLHVAAASASRVRLAVPTSFTSLIAAELAAFRARHPEISLEVLSSGLQVDLKKGEAELALRLGELRDPDLIARKVGEFGMSLYASPDYVARRGAPADPDALSGHDLIGFDAVLASSPPGRWMAEHGHGGRVVLRSRVMAEIVSAATDGLGLALLPCAIADENPRLRRLTPRVLCQHKVSLVYRREAARSREVRAVISFVVAAMKAQAPRLQGGASTRSSA
jgi:DNA-binding transcriptional LysR family regulator